MIEKRRSAKAAVGCKLLEKRQYDVWIWPEQLRETYNFGRSLRVIYLFPPPPKKSNRTLKGLRHVVQLWVPSRCVCDDSSSRHLPRYYCNDPIHHPRIVLYSQPPSITIYTYNYYVHPCLWTQHPLVKASLWRVGRFSVFTWCRYYTSSGVFVFRRGPKFSPTFAVPVQRLRLGFSKKTTTTFPIKTNTAAKRVGDFWERITLKLYHK